MDKIDSSSLLKESFQYVSEAKYLNMVKYSKEFQKKLNLTKGDYDDFFQIEIEIIPIDNIDEKDGNQKFINLSMDKSLYHIYFNDSDEEINRNFIKTGEKITKIRAKIFKEANSLKDLFFNCKAIKELKIIKFFGKNIFDMSGMFSFCSNLIKLDISKIKTDNVTDMNNMFRACTKLPNLELTNFKTDKVKNMSSMFYLCDSLTSLDLSSFNTSNVEYMNNMFYYCSHLKEIKITNFKIDKVTNMKSMFLGCDSLGKWYNTVFKSLSKSKNINSNEEN